MLDFISVVWNIFNNLTHCFFIYLFFLFTSYSFLNLWKRFSLATTRLLAMNWKIMVTRSNVCLSTPTFSLASEVNLEMKGNAKNMTHKLNIFWVEGAWPAKRVLKLELFQFFRQKPYININQWFKILFNSYVGYWNTNFCFRTF